mmetsp:Transcript_50007/g.102952  ORF Transcript_50007/g.102952 Transcript_50007/m.102952 type:complete len:196 (+) Transcript_50007:464-1051(+)
MQRKKKSSTCCASTVTAKRPVCTRGGDDEHTTRVISCDVSVISHGSVADDCGDVSSFSSCHEESEQAPASLPQNTRLPTPVSETTNIISSITTSSSSSLASETSTTEEDSCPRTGDCVDFEGRSYFFVDETEIETTLNKSHDWFDPPPRKLTPRGFPLPSQNYFTASNMLSVISRRRMLHELHRKRGSSLMGTVV